MTLATRAGTMTELPNSGEGEAYKVVWTGLDGDDDGEPVTLIPYSDRSVQVEGTFDSGTVTIKGSNDGTNYEALRDPSSTSLTFTAAGLKGILEAVHKIKPVVTGGGGSCALTVTMYFRKTK